MGFIFWPHSSRYVAERPDYLPARTKRVGVFVDADVSEVAARGRDYALDVVQLHGRETAAYVKALRAAWQQPQQPVIVKALNIATAADLEQTAAYADGIDYFLFDTKGKIVGGNGVKFDWSVLDHYAGPTPFLLSGGIGPDDADRVNAFQHPLLAGIDLNSRFEQAPALKDVGLLRTFLSSIQLSER